MCELTKKMMRCAVKLEVVEDERIVEFSDELRQRGMANIWLLRTNESNSFSTDAHIDKAELQTVSSWLREACTGGAQGRRS
jgi:hypothetical protein